MTRVFLYGSWIVNKSSLDVSDYENDASLIEIEAGRNIGISQPSWSPWRGFCGRWVFGVLHYFTLHWRCAPRLSPKVYTYACNLCIMHIVKNLLFYISSAIYWYFTGLRTFSPTFLESVNLNVISSRTPSLTHLTPTLSAALPSWYSGNRTWVSLDPPLETPLWFVAALVNRLVPWYVWLVSSALEILRLRFQECMHSNRPAIGRLMNAG